MSLPGRIVSWLDDRTGLVRGSRRVLEEPVPSSVGWRHALGSLTGALILIQFLSGLLLALYYVPHPDAALASIEFVERSVTTGALVRALHYWGASFILVALILHITRVFLGGAYRPPREVTWLCGLALLVLLLALTFTGQLLPWTQSGYWAASVGIEIAASVPLIGPSASRMLQGGDTLGALTLTRFHGLHVGWLPGLLCLLTVFHLALLRRHGSARPARDTGSATVPFAPSQLTRDLVVVSIGLAALTSVAGLAGGPENAPANPADTGYVPRPEWYFQAHYQLLRLTPGSLEVVSTFVLPAALLVSAAALPWLDRGRSSRLADRRSLVIAGIGALSSIAGLTAYGLIGGDGLAAPPPSAVYDVVSAGERLTVREGCRDCHVIGLEGGDEGPDLSGVGLRLQEPYLRRFLRDPKAYYPDIEMPAPKVSARELDELIAYLMSLQDR
jgi:ubiquinol-cytochrome c reductase cytochrome b subunit